MQHAFSSRLGQLAIGLMLVTSPFASEMKHWSEVDDYVKLEAVNAGNQHPVTFSAEQLENLLAHFYKKEGDKVAAPYFSEDETKRLAKSLVAQFGKAKAGDDVLFGSSYRPGNMLFMPRNLNAGRLFVENGRLNLLIGLCGESIERAYNGDRPLNHGSRIKPVNDMPCELLAANGAERVNSRPDWVSMDIATALATKPTTSFVPVAAPTTFQPAPAPAAAAAPRPAVQPTAPVAVQPTAAVLPAAPTSKVEERLTLLKRLKDNGLITDAEYEQKRTAILKDL